MVEPRRDGFATHQGHVVYGSSSTVGSKTQDRWSCRQQLVEGRRRRTVEMAGWASTGVRLVVAVTSISVVVVVVLPRWR